MVTDSSYAQLEGYIFRDDKVLSADADVVYYSVADGEKVSVGQEYAHLFSDTGLSQPDMAAKEKALLEISARISLLSGGIGNNNTLSDLGSVKDSINKSYYAYIDSILDGNIPYADREGGELLSSLADYSAIIGGEVAKNKLSELRYERDLLISSIGGVKTTLQSDRSFNFFHSADGYENIFHTSRLEGLTREGLDALISSEPENTDGVIGKMTYTSKWYLAIPINEAQYETFKKKVGSALSVSFSNTDNLTLEMLLESIYVDEESPDSAYMLLSSHSLARVAFLDREQAVSVLLDSCTGYRIPEEALHNEEGHDGVYILVGNIIVFRRVTVIGRGNGYYIVNTYEVDALENNASEIPYLNTNDMIVTSGNDLYDGKQLN